MLETTRYLQNVYDGIKKFIVLCTVYTYTAQFVSHKCNGAGTFAKSTVIALFLGGHAMCES